MTQSILGIIGGSGFYDMPGLTDHQWKQIDSPWGEPSDALLFAHYDDLPMVFLPRHGRGHRLSPSDINYRANIDCLKRAGVTDLLSISACGSLNENFAPGHFVLPNQFIDRTRLRAGSFFGAGLVAHVSMAEPVSPLLCDAVMSAAQGEDIAIHRGGTYVCIEGPQFSTRAESNLYRMWGCDVIGMTNMPEAKLAREAEICYASLAMVTDFDCWHPTHGQVEVAEILTTLRDNVERAADLVSCLARIFPRQHMPCPIGSDRCLDLSLVTPEEARDPMLLRKLDAVAGRILSKDSLG